MGHHQRNHTYLCCVCVMCGSVTILLKTHSCQNHSITFPFSKRSQPQHSSKKQGPQKLMPRAYNFLRKNMKMTRNTNKCVKGTLVISRPKSVAHIFFSFIKLMQYLLHLPFLISLSLNETRRKHKERERERYRQESFKE